MNVSSITLLFIERMLTVVFVQTVLATKDFFQKSCVNMNITIVK